MSRARLFADLTNDRTRAAGFFYRGYEFRYAG